MKILGAPGVFIALFLRLRFRLFRIGMRNPWNLAGKIMARLAFGQNITPDITEPLSLTLMVGALKLVSMVDNLKTKFPPHFCGLNHSTIHY